MLTDRPSLPGCQCLPVAAAFSETTLLLQRLGKLCVVDVAVIIFVVVFKHVIYETYEILLFHRLAVLSSLLKDNILRRKGLINMMNMMNEQRRQIYTGVNITLDKFIPELCLCSNVLYL